MISKFFLSIVLFSAPVWADSMEGESRFASIALSGATGRVGFVTDAKSSAEAMKSAERRCGVWDCVAGGWIENGCITFSTNFPDGTGKGRIAYAQAASQEESEKEAIRRCEFTSKNSCYAHTTACSLPVQYLDEEPAATLDAVLKIVAEGSPNAIAVLKVVNLYNPNVLLEKKILTASVAEKLRKHNTFFGTLTVFVQETGIGLKSFDRLLGFALMQPTTK